MPTGRGDAPQLVGVFVAVIWKLHEVLTVQLPDAGLVITGAGVLFNWHNGTVTAVYPAAHSAKAGPASATRKAARIPLI